MSLQDWKSFEELITKLHETGTVTVQHDVTLRGQSGASRQIDVLVTHTEGLYTHRILIECKSWQTSVKRVQIDAMVAAIQDLNASKGVFFTTKGYQEGAEIMARAKGIDLFLVQELTDEQWGAPGKVIDLYLQTVSRGIGNFLVPEAKVRLLPGEEPLSPYIQLDFESDINGLIPRTPISRSTKPLEESTLEELLNRVTMGGAEKMSAKPTLFNGGQDTIAYVVGRQVIVFDPEILVSVSPTRTAVCSRIEFDLAIRIDQTRLTIDRSKNYQFALAIQNILTGTTFTVSRRNDEAVSSLRPITPQPADQGEAVQNGSILKMMIAPFFDFNETAGRHEVPWPLDPESAPGA